MNESFTRWLLILTVGTSLIIIPATGVWLACQPGDLCLGKTGVGWKYIFCSFFIIFLVCCFFCGCCNKDNGQLLIASSCSGLSILIFIIGIALYALVQSTIGFSSLEKQIIGIRSWMDIKHCLHDANICSKLQSKYVDDAPDQFIARHLTRIESGCCKPPAECNFEFSSPTVWIKPSNETYSNTDCYKWDNDPKKLCYNCEICKLGLARDVKEAWTISGVIAMIAWLMPLLVFTFAGVLRRTDGGYFELN